MTKQELVQQAYGSHYEALKNNINDHGFIRRRVTGHGTTNGMEYEKFGFKREDLDVISLTSDGVYSWRPKCLIGIETNNGWTKLESGADLPELNCDYKFIWVDGNYGECNLGGLKALFRGNKITHWRPIVETPKPLY